MKPERSLYIDVEMTCWDGPPPEGQSSEIIQIGVAEVKLESLEISREAEFYVKPRYSTISDYCTALTGITAETVIAKGHPFPEIMRTLGNRFGPFHKPCFSWGEDESALHAACAAWGVPELAFRVMDLSLLFRMDYGLQRSPSLEVALESLNQVYEGTPHRALVDARNTAKLHIALIRQRRRLK